MKVKTCSNINCQISKSTTSFDIQDINCPYCNSTSILRLPDLNFNENEILQYEEYTNTIFEDYNSEEYSLFDFSNYYNMNMFLSISVIFILLASEFIKNI